MKKKLKKFMVKHENSIDVVVSLTPFLLLGAFISLDIKIMLILFHFSVLSLTIWIYISMDKLREWREQNK